MMTPIPTGVPGLDDFLGGFHVGDNVILENTVAAPPHALLETLMAESLRRGDQVFFVSFDASPAALQQRLGHLGPGLTLVDCFTHGHGSTRDAQAPPLRPQDVLVESPRFPGEFQAALERLMQGEGRRIFFIDSLNGMALLWGEERVRAFYAHMCPRLFDLGDLAVWVLHKGVQSPAFHHQIGHIAQVVLSLDRQQEGLVLRVDRALGRSAHLQEWHPVTEDAEGFRLRSPSS